MTELVVEQPSIRLVPSFLEFVADMKANNQKIWDPYVPMLNESHQDFIERLLRMESQPEKDLVPETVYWAVRENKVVGRISLRHRLEGNLFKMGGHIGYDVGPKWRRQGIATEMLRQVLKTQRAKDIGLLLLTCSPNNEASIRTILKNNGKFEKVVFVDRVQENRNHYWINLKEKTSRASGDTFILDSLLLKTIDLDQAPILQEIYNQSPTYFRRVDGTDPLPHMAAKDIEDIPPKRSESYIKVAALIYKDSEPIGYADLHVNHRTKGVTYLGLLLLKESTQGQGIGRKAYELVEKYLVERFQTEKIVLGVSNHNQVQSYWEKMGFKPNGETYTWKGEFVESLVTEMEKVL